MRAALISIVGQPREAESGAPVRLAGKSLAHRQLAFVLAAGAEQIVLLGDGASREAIELRHTAERAGARVLVIADGHGLLGIVRAADNLLVVAPCVLPEATIVLEMLGKGSSLLVLPAAQGVAAGFERIDLERAWAGALVIQGGLVERLAELEPDSDPAASLLRIALQAQVAERQLPETVLADGSWAMVCSSDEAASAEEVWLKRNLPPAPRKRPAQCLAALALRPAAAQLLERGRVEILAALGAIALSAAGVAVSVAGWAATGFALVALGVLSGEIGAGLLRMAEAPFGPARKSRLIDLGPRVPIDLSLVVTSALAIEQDWLHRIYPPLVLLGLLAVLRPEARSGMAALIGDRLLLALTLAFAAALGVVEPVVMALALGLIVLEAPRALESRG